MTACDSKTLTLCIALLLSACVAPVAGQTLEICRPTSNTSADSGIGIVNDIACVSHGNGCINDFCRLCQLFGTPYSLTYLPCSAPIPLSVPMPIVAGPVISTALGNTTNSTAGSNTTFVVAGILETDAGGLLSTNSTNSTTSRANSTTLAGSGANATALTTTPTPVSTTATPPPTNATPAPTTATPAPTTATPAPTTAPVNCAKYVTSGDAGVGLSAYIEPACLHGGVGCIGSGGCCYCKYWDTVQSKQFRWCLDA